MLVFGQKPVTDFRAVIGKVGKMKPISPQISFSLFQIPNIGS